MKAKNSQKRIYILPTKLGCVFVLGATLMILIGAAYQNNLVNLLAFFMLSLIFVGMIQTHNNLRDVRVAALEPTGGFAGAEFLLTSVLENPSRETRFNVEVELRKMKALSVYENVLPLLPRSTLKLRATYPAGKRGKHPITKVKVSSVYPLGLFRAWLWIDVDAHYLVYPECKGTRPMPSGGSGEDEGHVTGQSQGDDFHGHRKFSLGDSHRHIDWKAYARGRPLLVKEFNEGRPGSMTFDWQALEGLPTETRLSQLAAWVEEARRRKLPFALHLPGAKIPTGEGHQHCERCLEALALHEDTPRAAASR